MTASDEIKQLKEAADAARANLIVAEGNLSAAIVREFSERTGIVIGSLIRRKRDKSIYKISRLGTMYGSCRIWAAKKLKDGSFSSHANEIWDTYERVETEEPKP